MVGTAISGIEARWHILPKHAPSTKTNHEEYQLLLCSTEWILLPGISGAGFTIAVYPANHWGDGIQ